jgi:guanylate cyclase
MIGETTFWDGVAARVRPVGVAATVENPRTIVWIVTGALWASVVSSGITAVAFFWFDEPMVGWGSVLLSAAYLGAWVWFAATGSVFGTLVIIVMSSTLDIIFVHVAMGGYANSGAYLMWMITLVLSSALVFRRNLVVTLALVYTAVAVTMGFLEQSLQASRVPPDPTLPSLLFPVVLVGNLGLLALIFISLLGRLSVERERAEGLLLNVLPAEVATELKETGATTARHYESISVLFADIVGFTPLSAEMAPEEMVNQLNDVFTYFDALADKYGVEKIRTIGDNYMVASGVPIPRDDHALALAGMAVEMLEYSRTGPLSFRLGINSGPVVAGVIGTRKFQYDIWADTVQRCT